MRGMHSAVEFQGALNVTDPAKFHETFTRGIGSAKAFGFGLLVIAPAS
jgi:CRISPR system Cascade subunit CasE